MSTKRTITLILALIFTLLATISAVITVINIMNSNTRILHINFIAVICCSAYAAEKWVMLKNNTNNN